LYPSPHDATLDARINPYNLELPMKSLAAIIAGSLFDFIALLIFGLSYIFIAVGYNSLASEFPFLKDITDIFRYLIGFPIFIVTMFVGGYITADIGNLKSSLKVILNCFAVGLIAIVSTVYSALDYSSFTLTGAVVVILALGASAAGGFYWLRDNRNIGLKDSSRNGDGSSGTIT